VSNDEAEWAIEATLRTPKERPAGNEPDNLVAQLPRNRADPLRGEGGREEFALAELCRRIDEKEGVDEHRAIRHARAVVPVLQEAVATGEMDDVRGQLKPEYEELFDRPGEQPASAACPQILRDLPR
jgi:uncharacterized protein (DUF2267 family)